MSDLLKRIDAYTDKEFDEVLWGLLEDCRAEIERLRTYTPMTDDEMTEVIAQWYEDDSNTHALTRQIEQAVVNRIMGQ